MVRAFKVLFFVPYPSEGPSNRLRVEQYLPYLKGRGIDFKVRPFISRGFYRILYNDRFFLLKICYFFAATLRRMLDLFMVLRYDVIFIHREAFPAGPAVFENIIAKMRKPMVFDFDDAIFLPGISGPNTFMERFKRPSKVSRIISLSEMVIAGNSYLYDFAVKFNKNTRVIPTPIDTELYKPEPRSKMVSEKMVIGWIGTPTTLAFLRLLEKVIVTLSSKYGNLQFKVMGGDFKVKGLNNIVSRPWSLNEEVGDLNSFDIGVMPMPDNEWTRGKCAFKAILYMSMGKPCVCSAVGMNNEVVEDGVNGFLATSDKEWVYKLSLLIEDGALRERLGSAGRRTVEEKFSLKANAPKFLEILDAVSKKAA